MEVAKKTLFESIKVGAYTLKNRAAMAPLTRCRADYKTCVPIDMHVQYYTERAEDAGLIISECSSVSKRGTCFPGSCGIYSQEQVEGWQKVTESVHKVDGKIFLQIWHCGRAARRDWLEGEQPLAPSGIRNRHPARGINGMTEYDEPKEMTKEDIQEVLDQFRKGAMNAKKAGFDGVELHGANGYLIDEFLRDATNKRTDEYGGSVENRCRFPLQVMDILIEEFGADKVGIKVTPLGRFNDMFDSDPLSTFSYLFKELDKRQIAFIELTRYPEFRQVQSFYDIEPEDQIKNLYEALRPFFKGTIIANTSFDLDSANEIIGNGLVDMVSFGRAYIANPDLVLRFKNYWPLNTPNEKTFYTPGPEGYIDYPKF